MIITWKNVEKYVNDWTSETEWSSAQTIFEKMCSEFETDYLNCALINGEWYFDWNCTQTPLSAWGATIRNNKFVAL